MDFFLIMSKYKQKLSLPDLRILPIHSVEIFTLAQSTY